MNYKDIQRVWARRREYISRMVKSGVSQAKVASKFNISPSRVCRIVKRVAAKRNNGK